MKRVLILVGFLLVMGTASRAEGTPGGTGTVTTYWYGKKANTQTPHNPYAGPTTRVCKSIVEKYAPDPSGNGTIVTETIMLLEEDGKNYSVTTNTYSVGKSVEQSINESVEAHESNGGQVEREE